MGMSLSSLQIDAFLAVSETHSFTAAAKRLHITQSALSQRIKNLEDELGSTLFVRETSGVRATELGLRLLQYAKSKEALETQFLEQIKDETGRLSGIVRVGAFSTILRSLVVPSLANLIQENPSIQLSLSNAELLGLPQLLFSGNVDFVFGSQPIRRDSVENILLGYEEYVLVRAKRGKVRDDVFLDHDENDTTTLDFIAAQSRRFPENLRRNYFDEIETLIEGVKHGMGRAVVPLHLANAQKGIEIVSGYKPHRVPVYLSYFAQPFYTRLHGFVREALIGGVKEGLKANG